MRSELVTEHHHHERSRPHTPHAQAQRAEQHVPVHRRTELSPHPRTGKNEFTYYQNTYITKLNLK